MLLRTQGATSADGGDGNKSWSGAAGRAALGTKKAAGNCNLLRPLTKISFLMVPSGYILIMTKKNS